MPTTLACPSQVGACPGRRGQRPGRCGGERRCAAVRTFLLAVPLLVPGGCLRHLIAPGWHPPRARADEDLNALVLLSHSLSMRLPVGHPISHAEALQHCKEVAAKLLARSAEPQALPHGAPPATPLTCEPAAAAAAPPWLGVVVVVVVVVVVLVWDGGRCMREVQARAPG